MRVGHSALAQGGCLGCVCVCVCVSGFVYNELIRKGGGGLVGSHEGAAYSNLIFPQCQCLQPCAGGGAADQARAEGGVGGVHRGDHVVGARHHWTRQAREQPLLCQGPRPVSACACVSCGGGRTSDVLSGSVVTLERAVRGCSLGHFMRNSERRPWQCH